MGGREGAGRREWGQCLYDNYHNPREEKQPSLFKKKEKKNDWKGVGGGWGGVGEQHMWLS